MQFNEASALEPEQTWHSKPIANSPIHQIFMWYIGPGGTLLGSGAGKLS